MISTKKKFVQDKWAIMGPKMDHLITGSALRVV